MPESWKPNRVHAVLHVNSKDELLVIPDRARAGVVREPPLLFVIQALATLEPVTITEKI